MKNQYQNWNYIEKDYTGTQMSKITHDEIGCTEIVIIPCKACSDNGILSELIYQNEMIVE